MKKGEEEEGKGGIWEEEKRGERAKPALKGQEAPPLSPLSLFAHWPGIGRRTLCCFFCSCLLPASLLPSTLRVSQTPLAVPLNLNTLLCGSSDLSPPKQLPLLVSRQRHLALGVFWGGCGCCSGSEGRRDATRRRQRLRRRRSHWQCWYWGVGEPRRNGQRWRCCNLPKPRASMVSKAPSIATISAAFSVSCFGVAHSPASFLRAAASPDIIASG